jgi:uncharacterized protein YlxP (DUF503 family)
MQHVHLQPDVPVAVAVLPMQWVYNTTRICVATVSEDCLKIKSADACVNSLIDEQMESAKQEAASAQQHPAVLVSAVVASICGGKQ